MKIAEYLKSNLQKFKAYFYAFLLWLGLGLVVGAVCGVIGTVFAHSVSFVTELRSDNGWLLFLLPVGGLLSVLIYRICRVTGIGTNQVFEGVRSENQVPFKLAPAVFAGSVITHLLGGSAGREGAALQLGGSISSLLGRFLKLDGKQRHILTMCGMGALFSAIFGTPIGACVFAIEVVNVGVFCSAAIFPGIVSAVTASIIAGKLGVEAEHFELSSVPQLSFNILWRVALIAAAGAVVSMLFCRVMHLSEHLFEKYLKNPFLRAAVGGAALVLLTLALSTAMYNGSGMETIQAIFRGETVGFEAFALKILFTAITVAAGFKGGEIIPTLFIGAALGCAVAPLLGLQATFGAAVGMAALFCGVTNCPLATVILFAELFGGRAMVYLALSGMISFLLSGYTGLYAGQRLTFSKLTEEYLQNGE
ncbi:MAG: chloride channel protein [Clostridia bacterium]|nr:chloride channel protein [Clostridia bacterium]